MRLPSIQELVTTTQRTVTRFPFVILSAVAAAVLLWRGIDQEMDVDAGPIFAAILGISLFTAIELLSRRWSSPGYRIGGIAIALVLLVIYALHAGDRPAYDSDEIYRFGLIMLSSHLLVSFSSFIRRGRVEAFWEFNKTLFLRFLLSLLFSGVLFGGLAIAMLAVDQLFMQGSEIKAEAYARLFMVVGTIFTTLFFLAGIPHDPETEIIDRPYPKGLKILAQNLLLPLVALYLSILYLYALKIILEWEWPEGWVGWLVLSFSVLGILAFLLLYPLSRDSENRWIVQSSRWFYIAILPLIGLLFAAIFRRISDYGITEERYFVVALACWLVGISFYFILSKSKNIKVIPISLCALVLFSAFGPWSAFAVSTRSQVGRLEDLMVKNEMILDGKVDSLKGQRASEEDREQMRSIVHYLGGRGEFDGLEEWVGTIESDDDHYWERSDSVLRLLGLGYDIGDKPEAPVREGEISQIPAEDDFIPEDATPPTPGREFTLSPLAASWRESRLDVGDYDLFVQDIYRSDLSPSSADTIFLLNQGTYRGVDYQILFHSARPEIVVTRQNDTILKFDLRQRLSDEIGDPSTYSEEDSRMPRIEIGSNEGRLFDDTVSGAEGKGRLLMKDIDGWYRPDGKGGWDFSIYSIRFSILVGGLSEGEGSGR